MKNLFFIAVYCLLFPNSGNCQGMVVNSSFEDTIPCPVFMSPNLQCHPWFTPTTGSPDYWHQFLGQTACTGAFGLFGYQLPNIGNAYCGLGVIDNISTFDYREYLEGMLLDSMIGGHTYCVNFYVNLANTSQLAADRIGIYFSTDSITDYNTASMLLFMPQVENTGGVITDTLNWVLVSGSFTAQGGERYLTIGNFYADSNTTVVNVNGGQYAFAYYYIDDVSVVDCTVGVNEIKENENAVLIYPNPTKDYLKIKLNIKTAMVNFELRNVLNQVVLTKFFENKERGQKIDLNTLLGGMYFYSLRLSNEKIYTGKLSIVR